MSSSERTGFGGTIENLLIVTHAIPVQRIRELVPSELELDIIQGPEGEDVALVSVVCQLNRDMKWADEDEALLDYHQCDYLTYVRNGEEPATYVFASYVERGTPTLFRRLSMNNLLAADFDISLSYDPDRRSYRSFHCEVVSDYGDTLVEVRSGGEQPTPSTPFKSGEELARFITDRPTTYFTATDGTLAGIRWERGEMNPVSAELVGSEFELWEEMGVLREEEFELPYSVLIQPSVEAKGFPQAAAND